MKPSGQDVKNFKLSYNHDVFESEKVKRAVNNRKKHLIKPPIIEIHSEAKAILVT